MSIGKKSLSAEFIKFNQTFNLTGIARTTPLEVILDLGFDTGYKHNKMDHFQHKKMGKNNVLYVNAEYSMYYMECVSTDFIEEEDHYICIARIMDIVQLNNDPLLKPLSYHFYLKNMQPVIISKLPQEQKCSVCGYIHEGPVAPKECPVCGQPAEYFKPYVHYIKK
jgi:flavin reductase (DIM6/NTAB) family NADH-FMN oxidoreductase RutF